MYELILVAAFGYFAYRAFSVDHAVEDDLTHKISDKVGKLWDVVHQGMRENRFVRAEKALLTILKIDKKNAAAYNRLGILYAKQKEFKDAIDCFEIACSIEPSASSLHNLGLIYYETENYEKAATAFEEAINLDDHLAARHIALAKTLEHLGNDKLMLEHLIRSAELEPSRESYRHLIEFYKKHGQEEKADILQDKIKRMNSNKNIKSRLRVKRRKKVVV